MPRNNNKKPCTGLTRAGEPCKAWALHDSNPPLCAIHAKRTVGGAKPGNDNRKKHGFYGTIYTLEEAADLVAHALDDSVEDELAITRVAVRRLIEYITQKKDELKPKEMADLMKTLFSGTSTIGRLMRQQKGNTGDLIAQALSELGDELGVEFVAS